MSGTDPWTVATIICLTLVTVPTRSFFFLSGKSWSLHRWAQSDARLFAAIAGVAWYYWRRGVLGAIVAGMAVYLPLRLGLGW